MASSKGFAALVIAAALLLALVEPSVAQGISSRATFYTPPYQPSSCFGFDPLPADFLFAAASPAVFNNRAACGTFFCVRCTGNGCRNGNTIRVQIVDLCPGCPGAFDLSQEAFARIADPAVGVISVNYNAC
ncbi:hypothetical protein SELMODRAFT_111663 [Selaginella moellendorffii]|uniref:Expansin-like EG45 domain-containing protein n=1 Tax=Selaginella moellendorffii TaxID=88036 RepID=D8S8Y3_SELML|nr:EG45-like domain containing protein [Selaginella moellendorffii]XP_002988363.1 EG45-like domain containing protein [Selaginella moellendorffii]EFJ10453.1 hypothetical protein SELMODRAFT_229368 [Selaginella moellendorffii]EFJ19112.1 hypothetical protein SELMODRAFT_111663 [Selaginella moellendorffii]|eukprot:XP_002979710.1 EG45-like domain containing protein [Selaginella moellendorffii]